MLCEVVEFATAQGQASTHQLEERGINAQAIKPALVPGSGSVEGTEEDVRGDKIVGIDLGLKDFAIVHDGEKVEKFTNPQHLKRHEKNLARKQKKHARKQKGSKSKEKSRKL